MVAIGRRTEPLNETAAGHDRITPLAARETERHSATCFETVRRGPTSSLTGRDRPAVLRWARDVNHRILGLTMRNFRTLTDVQLPSGPLTVLSGPNAAGK